MKRSMIVEFGPALRRAKSLLSIHFNGNDGVSQQLKDDLHERVHCMPHFETINLNMVSSNNISKV